jgi:hypothetical protein
MRSGLTAFGKRVEGAFRGYGMLRIGVFLLGSVFLLIGLATLRYPPTYLLLAPVWASVFLTSGVLCMLFGVKHYFAVGVLAGAMSIAASIMRSIAILTELGWSGIFAVLNPSSEIEPITASFFIGAVQWLIIGLLLLLIWPVLLVSAKAPK